MTDIIAPDRKSSSKTFQDICRDTSTPEGRRDIARILEYDAKRFANVAPDESRARMQQARALRGQPQLTGTIIPPMRICRLAHRTPRARARHTQTSQATSSGSDSGGDPDPDPEPPRRPNAYIYNLPEASFGGAL
jgi:hypothetical protein